MQRGNTESNVVGPSGLSSCVCARIATVSVCHFFLTAEQYLRLRLLFDLNDYDYVHSSVCFCFSIWALTMGMENEVVNLP